MGGDGAGHVFPMLCSTYTHHWLTGSSLRNYGTPLQVADERATTNLKRPLLYTSNAPSRRWHEVDDGKSLRLAASLDHNCTRSYGT
jgi:hypothetical protein